MGFPSTDTNSYENKRKCLLCCKWQNSFEVYFGGTTSIGSHLEYAPTLFLSAYLNLTHNLTLTKSRPNRIWVLIRLPVTSPQKSCHMVTSPHFEKVGGDVGIGEGKCAGMWGEEEEMWEEV